MEMHRLGEDLLDSDKSGSSIDFGTIPTAGSSCVLLFWPVPYCPVKGEAMEQAG